MTARFGADAGTRIVIGARTPEQIKSAGNIKRENSYDNNICR